MTAATIGIDFGTSNSAAAILKDGRAVMIPARTRAPDAADRGLSGFRQTNDPDRQPGGRGDDRRPRRAFHAALKSILGTPLARERRQFLNRRLTLLDIVAEFLAEVRTRAEVREGRTIRRAIAGRPVRFHSADPERNARAAEDLAECYAMAGFEEVQFLPEPEAAARAAGVGPGVGLIVDIGGGTSDFTLFEPLRQGIAILASHGIRLGGTDFDRLLSLARVMPLLGLGSALRKEIGPGQHQAPQALFHDLASWEKIAFLYSPATLRDARRMQRLAVEPCRFGRLVAVLETEIGHDMAFAVEAAKVAANDAGTARIALDPVEPGLAPPLSASDLADCLTPSAWQIGLAIEETLSKAGLAHKDISRVIFVGGSSLLGVVERQVMAMLPGAAFERSDVFTAVVRGLAMAAAEA